MTEPTGWHPSALMQDDCKALSKWLAKRACCICWKKKAKEQPMTTEPTDAELWQLWIPMAGRSGVADPVDFARAVLQRWGQPSGAGEVVAWESTTLGYTKYLTQSRYEMFSPAARAWYKPYKCSNCAAPQPTQAVPPAGRDESVNSCWCLTCRPMRLEDPFSIRMALCPTCGNKRCPKANDHRNECTGSNAPGQPGSAYFGGIKGKEAGNAE
ncbi:hypothetical protein J2W88_003969 [Acidovorax delafieldii]|uniref:Uncharacterized protein n=1 Tax=Acidovorax delafieldii TaxID=47920 RepID=A0AAJ2BYW4_ACIDE|nr:hypothetical protein [Acidovorax delafieldii]MDR6768665.1 hypothetical protein [Acidovorax delafieldii]MDR6837381.1 hypothetical protein [Acidovorax delafieldii]MDR7366871.1 hypothetical protein [Acidovorax delafieldii]